MVNIEQLEYRLILEAIFEAYGYDFRNYSEASLKRRLKSVMETTGAKSFSQLQDILLHDPESFAVSLPMLTVVASEMFRDPGFFLALKEQVFPFLSTYPSLKIWSAGAGSGEEVYSLAILLKEEGLYDRTVIYATDVNPQAIKTAKAGIYPAERIKVFSQNFYEAGGSSLTPYYTVLYDRVLLDKELRKNILFFEHNLVTDSAFAECHLILCRNVLIYFRKGLQQKVLDLFSQSLVRRGFLGLGNKETLRLLDNSGKYEDFVKDQKIFRFLPMGDS